MNDRGKKKGFQKITSVVLATAMLLSTFPLIAEAGDTWPFQGASAHGINQPSVHGYTSSHVMNWSPETDPDAELLRSRVPLQKRIDPFAATQANPNLSPDVKMMNVAGDYGNAFIENAPYTNKFAQYHFNFWQYIDFYSYWHGTATAYTPPEYYDDLAQRDWQQKWFEFGMLNIPNPTYTDAAHKNGVLSLAGIFFSNNDRGQQTYKQMIVKDEAGNYPVAEKLIEMAHYFGYDGYFVNQEEQNPNVAIEDIPDYIGFMKALQKGGLYVQWYDSLNTSTGQNMFARTFNDNNISFLYDKDTGEQVSQSFFFDYGMGNNQINAAENYLSTLNQTYGERFNIYDVGYAGLEAGRDRFKSVQGSALRNKLDSNGLPRLSISTLGADFVHAGLDEDMGQPWPVNRRAENDYQWMTKVREQLWWSGPNIDPTHTAVSTSNTASDVHADNRYWPGMASVIAERSVIGDTHFYTNFNTGHGLSYYVNGAVSNTEEWSNMSLQDIPVTWQWWQETAGDKLQVDFDYGPEYNIADTSRFDYEQIGAYEGGSSLVVSGQLDAENLLRLYKTDLSVGADSKLSVTYNKTAGDDGSTMSIGLIMKDDPSTVIHIPVPDSGRKTNGWVTTELDLSPYAGKSIATLGLVFDPGAGSVADYQMNIGQLRIYDGSIAQQAAPTGLTIAEAYTDTGEMVITWNMDPDYSKVKQYNIYVNDVYVGGKYDDIFYIKNLPARSGVVKVAAVGADGREGEAATVRFDLTESPSDIIVDSRENGDFLVSWTNPQNTAANMTVSVKSRNWITTPAPVSERITVPAGETSVMFQGMPINGDDYIVTLSAANITPVSVSGNFIDKVAEPYAEDWSWDGNTLNLPMPNTRDWRYMYVYEDGKLREFPTTYNVGNKDRIIRGRTTKASLKFTSTAQNVYVVMEDYAGNRSEPVYLKGKARYIVTFDTNGGVPAVPHMEAAFHAPIAEPAAVSRAGYVFDGWYTANGVKWDFASDTVKEDVTLTAKWKLAAPEVRMSKSGAFREGGSGSLFAVAVGQGTLSYEWHEDHGSGYTPISVTEATYALPAITMDMEGSKYKVVVTNEDGLAAEAETIVSVVSADADLIAPGFETDLDTIQTVTTGDTVTLFVVPEGDVDSLAWEAKAPGEDEWSPIAHGIPVYTFTANAEDNGTEYRVVLTGKEPGGTHPVTAVSQQLTLQVNPIVSVPEPQIQDVTISNNSAKTGDEVSITVQATGSDTLRYQWRKDNASIPGATDAVYRMESVTEADAGIYTVEVTNLKLVDGQEYSASKMSDPVQLTVEASVSTEWMQLHNLLSEIDVLRANDPYTAESIAALRSSSAYSTAKSLTAGHVANELAQAYANLLQAKRVILVVYVPVTPPVTSPGSGSGNGTPGNTPAPAPRPDTGSTVAVISPEELGKPETDGVKTIAIGPDVTTIELPLHASELLGSSRLEVATDRLTIELGTEILSQLRDLTQGGASSGGKIVIGIQTESLNESVTNRNMVNVNGYAVGVNLAVVTHDGQTQALSELVQPLKIKLPVGASNHVDLLGIYQVGSNGSLTYVGGTRVGEMLETEVKQTGTFVLMEYHANFTDVPNHHWAAEAVQILAAKHLIKGVSEDQYQPHRPVTRAEFVAIMARALGLQDAETLNFSDVAEGAWYEEELARMVKAGLINGRKEDRFEPNASISRQEIVTILMRAYRLEHGDQPIEPSASVFADEASVAPWALLNVREAAAIGLVQGRGNHFAPAEPASRAETAQMILNYIRAESSK